MSDGPVLVGADGSPEAFVEGCRALADSIEAGRTPVRDYHPPHGAPGAPPETAPSVLRTLAGAVSSGSAHLHSVEVVFGTESDARSYARLTAGWTTSPSGGDPVGEASPAEPDGEPGDDGPRLSVSWYIGREHPHEANPFNAAELLGGNR